MECFADRIRFFFFTYFGYFAPFSFHSYSAQRKRAGCRAISKYCGCLRFPRLTSPFLNIQPFILSYFSRLFDLFATLLSTTHTFFVFHITLQLMSHLLFSPPRG
jgi:hypothetical protein